MMVVRSRLLPDLECIETTQNNRQNLRQSCGLSSPVCSRPTTRPRTSFLVLLRSAGNATFATHGMTRNCPPRLTRTTCDPKVTSITARARIVGDRTTRHGCFSRTTRSRFVCLATLHDLLSCSIACYLVFDAEQIQLGSLLLVSTEQQPPASRKVAAVVVAIDFSAKKLQLVAVAPRTHVKETVASPSHAGVIEDKPELRFREIELQYPWLDHGRLEPFSSITESDFEWAHSLSEYGICGTCRRVFHISQGDPKSKDANEELIRCYEAALEALRMRKQHQVRERKFTLVPDTTTDIRAAEQRIRHAKRQLEFLEPLSCPFCGWVESAASRSSSPKETSGGMRTFG